MDINAKINSVTPKLVVDSAADAIDFYVRALGAVEKERHEHGGRIAHALLDVAGYPVALKDRDDHDPSPRTLGGSPVILSVGVTDADAVTQRMVDAGASVVFPVADHGYGYKDGRLADPYGQLWLISEPLNQA